MKQPKLVVIDNLDQLDDLFIYLQDKDYVAFDTETNGVHKGAEIIGLSFCAEEEVAYYVITAAWNTSTSKLDSNADPEYRIMTQALIESLQDKHLIAHNAVFDCSMIESNYKVSLIESMHTDTMILAHLLNENRRVGLKELGADLFGQESTVEAQEMKASVLANGGQLTKANFEMYKADSRLMAKYGAKDAWLTYMLFVTLVPELYEQGLDKFFYEDESMPLLKGPTYELNTVGLNVDLPALIVLKKTLQAECAEAKEFIYREIQPYIKDKYPGDKKTNIFNIGASQQLSWLLFGVLNLEFGTLTAGGKTVAKQLGMKTYTPTEKRNFVHRCQHEAGLSVLQPAVIINGKTKKAKLLREPWAYIAVDKKTLTKLAPKYKWIERLLEYQRKMKLLTTYVKGTEERTQYGVIRPSYLQHGTTSGRYASRNPNFQNLPRDDKRIKECIIARPGRTFVGADYSQLEPRVFAYYSGDKRLLAAFDGTSDFYSVIGMEVFGKIDCEPQKEGSNAFGTKYKKLRDLSKVVALASTYGATAHQLAPTTGKSIEDTQQIIDDYFENFPGVAEMMLEAHKLVKTNGHVTNLFGRKRRIPEGKRIVKIYGDMAHADYPYEVRNMLNLAVNHRIQSTGASIVNRAAIAFHKHIRQAGLEAKLVSQVHDSLIVECNEADAPWVAALLEDAMVNTIKLEGITLEAIPKIGKTLADV